MSLALLSESQISFADDPIIGEVRRTTARLAQRLQRYDESRQSDVAALREAIRHVRQIQLLDLLTGQERDADIPEAALFHVADSLGAANLTVAWQGLRGVPVGVALTASGHHADDRALALALPWVGAPAGWLLIAPLCLPNERTQAWLLDGSNLVGPSEIADRERHSSLLGFPHGGIVQLHRGAGQSLSIVSLSTTTYRRLLDLSFALLAGLLSGALRRMVDEAYAYARTRKSGGKAISQHQAVALRLADLTLNQQGIALYLQAAIEQPAAVGCEGPRNVNIDYVDQCSARIASDAVQVAAAHGYVEGLAFKRLFEQTRTLVSSMALMSDASCSDDSSTQSTTFFFHAKRNDQGDQ